MFTSASAAPARSRRLAETTRSEHRQTAALYPLRPARYYDTIADLDLLETSARPPPGGHSLKSAPLSVAADPIAPYAGCYRAVVRLVAEQQTLQHVAREGGNLFLWARGYFSPSGYSYVLEASTRAPDKPFHRIAQVDGISVWLMAGLIEPKEIHLEVSRRGKLRAYWNGLAWLP